MTTDAGGQRDGNGRHDGPAVDEVLASLQFLRRRRTQGRSLWRAFWGVDGEEDLTASETQLAGTGSAR